MSPAVFAYPDNANVQFFGNKACRYLARKTQKRKALFIKIPHEAANTTYNVLMLRDICVESSDSVRRADPADEPLVLEELEYPVNSRVRQGRHAPPQPGVNRIRRRMARIRGQNPVNGQALGGDPDTPVTATFLEVIAPPLDLLERPPDKLSFEAAA